ncbi:DUF2793 domain-containing protein [Paraburkholderia aspalathi]|nr:DUF2793 domain-containing protein [Paraburkholderia aspalathi]
MPSRILPGLGLSAFWALGEDGWKDGMDANILLLSIVGQLGVKSKTTALPASPAQGDIYIEPSGADAGKIAVRDNNAWVKFVAKAGWRTWVNDTKAFAHFNGTAWVDEADDAGIPEAPEDGKTYGRKNADWAEVTGGGGGATHASISAFIPGKPAAAQRLIDYQMLFAGTLPLNAAESLARCAVAPTAAVSIVLLKNTEEIDTLTFAAASTTGVFTVGLGVSFAVGDVLTLMSQAVADATMSDLSIALKLNL